MCFGEIVWRIKRLIWQIYARFQHKRWELQYKRSHLNSTEIVRMLHEINFYGLSDIRPNDVPENWVNGTTSVAEKLLQHRYSYLALGEIDLGEEINWNHEYKRNIDTPLDFGPWMDYRDTELYGDFKYFWEVPRLQHLITLAKAYYLTSKEDYAEEVAKQIGGFIKQSPFLLGINWIMPMEAAIRLVSVSWITAFLKEYLKKHANTCGLIEQVVKSHVDYVIRNYAGYSSANNHLIAEAAGVFIASICFNQLEKMSIYREKAYDILCREIIRQHYTDGVNKEQAIHYQIFAFNFFLLTVLLARANSIEFPDQYWEMLEKSANFIVAIADNDCLVPDIGDNDDGKALVLSESDHNAVQSILATSAVLFERSDFKAKAKVFDETSFWLLGRKGKDKFDNLNTESVLPTKRFDWGGYYVLSSDNGTKTKVIFDCGPLGFEPIAAHGHADSLSFILSAYDRSYFIDPGTYIYIADNPYRDYFRSTQAHNTVVIDGKNQSEMGGAFLWTHKASSFVDDWVSNEHYDKVVGWHDGYHRLQDPVTHRRAVKLDKEQGIITIDDYLGMKTTHKIEQYFHLAPQCHVGNVGRNKWRIANGDKSVELVVDSKLNCEVYTGSENPICGWFSGGYNRKCPIQTFVCRGLFCGNQHLTTRIRLAP